MHFQEAPGTTLLGPAPWGAPAGPLVGLGCPSRSLWRRSAKRLCACPNTRHPRARPLKSLTGRGGARRLPPAALKLGSALRPPHWRHRHRMRPGLGAGTRPQPCSDARRPGGDGGPRWTAHFCRVHARPPCTPRPSWWRKVAPVRPSGLQWPQAGAASLLGSEPTARQGREGPGPGWIRAAARTPAADGEAASRAINPFVPQMRGNKNKPIKPSRYQSRLISAFCCKITESERQAASLWFWIAEVSGQVWPRGAPTLTQTPRLGQGVPRGAPAPGPGEQAFPKATPHMDVGSDALGPHVWPPGRRSVFPTGLRRL